MSFLLNVQLSLEQLSEKVSLYLLWIFCFSYWFTLVDPLVLARHIQKFSIRMIWCKSFCTSNTSEKLFRYSHSPPLLMISWHLIELTGGGCTCNCCNCRCVNKVTLIEHKRQGHPGLGEDRSTFQCYCSGLTQFEKVTRYPARAVEADFWKLFSISKASFKLPLSALCFVCGTFCLKVMISFLS